MRNRTLTTLLFHVILLFSINAQSIEGRVNDANGDAVIGAAIKLLPENVETLTNALGIFRFNDLSLGTKSIEITHNGQSKTFLDISVNEGNNVLAAMSMDVKIDDATQEQIFGVVSISENDLDSDNGNQDVSSILSAGRDPFLSTAAFAFGNARFRVRGMDNNFNTFFINGIPMNELESGRLYYNQWGGLNDILRNVHINFGLSHSEYGVGGIMGASNVNIRAGAQREQTRISYAVANRSYRNRIMFTHAKGFNKNGLAYFVSGSRRWAQEGYVEGTFYDAYSYAFGLEKRFSTNSSLFLNVMGAPNKRGKQSASLQEINDIIDNNYYNSYWGWQEGKKRNSRVGKSHQPIIMAGYDWAISDKLKLNIASSYQFGENGGSALNWLDAGNPAADYHQKLPTRIEDETLRNEVINILRDNPDYFQIDWAKLYEANRNNTKTINNINGGTESITGNQAKYVVENRRFDSKELNTVAKLTFYPTERNTSILGAYYRDFRGHNFAELEDLLGADFYLDYDNFADAATNPGSEQKDLNNPNAIKYEGDIFNYDYNSTIIKGGLWVANELRLKKFDLHFSGDLSSTQFWRTGNMKNGYHPDNSFGDAEKQNFLNYMLKGGVTYKLSGRNYFWANGFVGTEAPSFRNSYVSNRNSNELVPLFSVLDSSTMEMSNDNVIVKSKGLELGYSYTSSTLGFKLNSYYMDIDDLTEISFFFSENATGEVDGAFGAFVNHNIDRRHVGIEAAVTASLGQRFSAKAVAAIGQHLYDSRWRNFGFADVDVDGDGNNFFRQDFTVYSNEFYVESSPQRAYNFELKYDSPKFWFATINFNYFQDRYLDFSPERRIEINTSSLEGQELRDVSIQEKVADTYTVDIFAYKSWKLKDYFIILTASVNNVLDNRSLISGGYEQLRYDPAEGPDYFDTRYYYGYGRNYFLQMALKF